MDQSRNDLLAKNAYEFYPGWKHLIQPLVDICNREDIGILQIKEKFGSLRFYTTGTSIDLESAYKDASSKSTTTCPQCGKENQVTQSRNGWWTSICDDCYKVLR